MSSKNHRLLLGAHVSIAGGLQNAFARAQEIGCTTMQIFSKSNRQWNAKPIAYEEAQAFKQAQERTKIDPVIVHATYLLNLATPDMQLRAKSIQAIIDEVYRCEQLNIPYLVIHPGSRLHSNEEVALQTIAQSLEVALEASNNTQILLEIMAGQGSVMCYSFEQLAQIINGSKYEDRLGICFDTCHAFAAGYDFSTPQTYEALWDLFDKIIGISKLKALHLNDSKKECGSRVDRHEDIGKGKIGLKAFELIMNDPKLFDVPKILETPHESPESYIENMRVLKGLLSRETKKLLEVE